MPGMCTVSAGGIGEIEVCTKSATPFFEVGALYSR